MQLRQEASAVSDAPGPAERRRDLLNQLTIIGWLSLGGFFGKMHGAMKNLANTAMVNIDVSSDDFLHRIGLKQHRKYNDGRIDQDFKDHAHLHKDAYLGVMDRKGTYRYSYLNVLLEFGRQI